MNYKIIYENIIEKARLRETICNFKCEKHHVIPKCMGGINGEIVPLTYKEHFISHMILAKINPENYKISESNKGKPSGKKGKCTSEETKKKISESKKGKATWNKGKYHSEETKKKIQESCKKSYSQI
jgi:hypothetical protein